MLSRRRFTLASVACAAAGCGFKPEAPAHSRLAALAVKEGALRIDAAMLRVGDPAGRNSAAEFLRPFQALHPEIAIDFRRQFSGELHDGFVREVSAGQPTADLLISSAMDLQFKLVNDGFAQTYASPEKPHLPDWAVWKDQAYAVTAEPLVFAYNRALMPATDVPGSHDELADLLRRKPEAYRGKIATYDPERSGTGYLYYTQDLLLSRDTLDLVQAVGRTQPRFYVSGGEAMDKVERGEHLLAYNMVSSEMLERQGRNPNIGIVFPDDYTLVMSRIALIPTTARHPAAARLFLDFLLSEAGQTVLARRHMQPTRIGIPMEGSAPSTEVLRRIHFGPSLLANLDTYRRQRVLREWRNTFQS